jgi:mono/diheme cytochrome c family protein
MAMTLGEPKATAPVVTIATDGPVQIVAEVGIVPQRLWNHWKTAFLIALPLLMALYVFLVASGIHAAVGYQPPEAVALVHGEPDGAALYAQNCARCHGIGGNADGLASPYLDPPARRFGQEKFKLGTSSTGIPSDNDLVYLMKHGIPGTAMPEFPNLNDDQARAIATHLRRLTYVGLYAKRFQLLAKDEDPDPKEVHQWTAKQVVVGESLPLPANLTHPGPGAIEHGRQIFQSSCATCHGATGDGNGPGTKDLKDEFGRPTRPRDLARGIYKGGGEADRLFARVSLGMPGTPMPDLRILPSEDRADLVHFVRSLSGREPGTP